MALDKISEQLLNGIFYALLKSPDGLNALKYRADNEQFIPELDQLEHLGYVQRYNDLYSIKPLALAYLAGENPDASRIVNMCVLVFALLRGAYKDDPKQSITAPNISKSTGLSEHDVGTVLRIIIQTPILAHYSSHLSGERAHVTPSENILRYSSFEDVLQEMQESAEKQKNRSQEPVITDTKSLITQTEQANGIPIDLFDAMRLHPRVIKSSRKRFQDGNYTDAIYRAYVELNNFVKEKSRLRPHELRGMKESQIMAKVFDVSNPIIKLNELQTDTNISEQEGFRFLFMGATIGIRNPKAHENISQSDHIRTLEYLGFASLLMRQVDEGNIVRTSQPRRKWDWDIFIKDTKEKCEQKIIGLIKNLYDFTSVNSDSISWGTGKEDGSFTFRKLCASGEISIFSVYSCGWVYVNFGSMINKNVPDSIIETFRTSLNNIPNIKIPKSAITDGKYIRINENLITNLSNLQIFGDAVISLCQQLENN